MNVEVMICAYGDPGWRELLYTRALPSVASNGVVARAVYEPDGTLAGVRNAAAEKSRADWLCFLDADDELASGYLTAMRHTAHRWNLWRPEDVRANPLLLAPAVEYVLPDGTRSDPSIPNAGKWPDFNECVIGTLIPRWLFEEVGGFRELPSLEDYDLTLRCVKAGARIEHVPKAVYVAHVSPAGRNGDQSVYHRLRREHAEVWALQATQR